jgi:hypothetical protein
MNRYRVTSLLLALIALIFVCYPQQFSQSGGASGQKRRPRRITRPGASRKAAIDYSRFSHGTKEHQEGCGTCHKAPTANWQKAIDFPEAGAFPDAADFPAHDSCIRCHRAQFFRGAQPVICSVCHTKTSPRDDARSSFRKPISPWEFRIEFPHDKHQDVIASLHSTPKFGGIIGASFVKSAYALDEKKKKYNNCEICHATNAKEPVAPAGGWVDGYVPPADTFKTAPNNHASCFNCHWTRQEPTANNCAGCHKLANTPYVPASYSERKSMKFRHDGGGEKSNHAVPPTECTVCHINITKSGTLRGLKPDVPIFPSCATSSCHQKVLGEELNSYDKAPGVFKCVKCHTSEVGTKKPPNSHKMALLG